MAVTMIGFVLLMIGSTRFWLLAIAIASSLRSALLLALYYIPSAYRLLSDRRPAPADQTSTAPAFSKL